MTKKFIMVSLDEKKAKKLAEVISNDTARKILDYLSDKGEATTSQISKELGIAISTVDYNIKNLIDNDLVESKEFKWSPKGRQMDIYRLANKHIIISPKRYSEFKETLKKVLPVAIIGVVAGIIIELKSRTMVMFSDTIETITKVQPIAERAMEKSVAGLGAGSVASAPATTTTITQEVIERSVDVIPRTVEIATQNGIYFIIGVIFASLLYLIFSWRKK